MDTFLKAIAGTLIATILYIILGKHGKDISVLLMIAVCTILAVMALQYITPVIDFVIELQNISKMDSKMLQIVLRAVGIGLITEFATLICTDAGNTSMSKGLQLLATGIILWLSLPLFTQIIDTIEELFIMR